MDLGASSATGVRAHPDGSCAYVAVSGGGGVMVVDLKTFAVTGPIPVSGGTFPRPRELVIIPQGAATATATPMPSATAMPTVTPSSTMTPSAGATPSGARHVQCYSVDRERVAAIPGASIDDRFGRGTADLRRPTRLCAPADKDGEDPDAPTDPAHFLGYELTNRAPHFRKMKNVAVANQFGQITVELQRPVLLMLPTRKSRSGDPGGPAGLERTPLQCYLTKGGRTRVDDLSVTDQFGTLTIDVKRPFRLCTPAVTGLDGDSVGTDALMCYRVKQSRKPRFKLLDPLFVHDEFASRRIQIKQPTELCVPSMVTVPALQVP